MACRFLCDLACVPARYHLLLVSSQLMPHLPQASSSHPLMHTRHAPPHGRHADYSPCMDCSSPRLAPSPPSSSFSNVALSIRPLRIPYLKRQPLLQHTLSSFLIFLIVYRYTFYLLIYFMYCVSPELSPIPKR